MYPRTNYEMTETQETRLLDAMRSTPAIMVGGMTGRSQQERANDAWAELGKEMGFDHMTVQPRNGYGQRHFTEYPVKRRSSVRSERLCAHSGSPTSKRGRVKLRTCSRRTCAPLGCSAVAPILGTSSGASIASAKPPRTNTVLCQGNRTFC
jgi:hypothetical protein